MPILFDKEQGAHVLRSRFPNELARCIACGQPASIGQFCQYRNGMREELRCWPKQLGLNQLKFIQK